MAQFFYDFAGAREGDNPGAPPGFVHAYKNPATFDPVYSKFAGPAPDGVGFIAAGRRKAAWTTGDFSNGWMFAPAGMAAVLNAEVLAKVQHLDDTGTNYSNSGLNIFLRASDPAANNFTDGYEVGWPGTISSNAGPNVRDRVGGTVGTSSQFSGAGITRSNRKIVWYRVGIDGTNLRAKAWEDGTAEPAWSTQTRTAVTTAGVVAIGVPGMNVPRPQEVWTRFMQVSVGTDGDAAPMTNPVTRQVLGTVRTPAGDLAAGYLVRCYLRSTGKLIGETLTDVNGQYAFTVGSAAQVYVMAIDQLGNSWNVPAKDRIIPFVV